MNEMKNRSETMGDIIGKLRSEWVSGSWTPHPAAVNWGGADLCIEPEPIGTRSGIVVVVTRYSLELSSLFEELRDRLSGSLDYLNKYAFYPRIGVALNRCIETGGDELDALIDTALREAAAIAAEWEKRRINEQ